MSSRRNSDIDPQLEDARRMIAAGNVSGARTQLRVLRRGHPDSLEVMALLLRALSTDMPPDREVAEEIEELMDAAPEDTAGLNRLCRLLLEEGEARAVEGLLTSRWKQLMRLAGGMSQGGNALLLEATTLLAESFMALWRGSSALDLVDEARALLPMPELDALRERLAEAFDPNDQPVMAELHAVRRKISNRFLEGRGADEFADMDEAMAFHHAFQAAWNSAMAKRPLPYAMMTEEMRAAFLDRLYENVLAAMDTGDGPADEADEDEVLAVMKRLIHLSGELFEHPLFEAHDAVKPFAVFLPEVMDRLDIPMHRLEAFLGGRTDPAIIEDLRDAVSVLAHIAYLRMAENERSYQEAFASLYDITAGRIGTEDALEAIVDLGARLDLGLQKAGIQPVRFLPGGAKRPAGPIKAAAPKGGGNKGMKKKKR